MSAILEQRFEVVARAGGEEFVLGIVMMDAVAEEHPLGIFGEKGEILAFAVSAVILKYVLDCVAELEVVPAVLVPDDVAAVL